MMGQIIYCDGEPAIMEGQYGKVAVISEEHGSHVLDILSSRVSVNQAEYLGMREALIIANDGDTICSDSQLVVGQLTKNWAVNANSIKKLFEDCKKLYDSKHVTVNWVSRNDNLAGHLLERLKGRSMFDDVNLSHMKTMSEVANEPFSVGASPKAGADFDPERAFCEIYVSEHYVDDKKIKGDESL